MDYEKLHKDTINKLQQMVNSGKITVEIARGICADFVPESEDERIRKRIIHALHGDVLEMSEIKEAVDWLEKQGEQNSADKVKSNLLTVERAKEMSPFMRSSFENESAAWSEEDEEMVQVAINACNSYQDSLVRNDSRFDKAMKAEDWLKSLKDKYVPQSKIEWSEEDSDMLQSILDEYKSMAIEKRNWLKSLKDRYAWKPSDEHYELEEFAKIVRCNLTGISKTVQELFKAKYLQLTGRKMYGGFKD